MGWRYVTRPRFALTRTSLFPPRSLATRFSETARNSPSFPREIQLREASALAIEYAIWWDWDIQHLYELEHIWVYIDGDGKLVAAEASWHGGFNQMLADNKQIPILDSRLALYSEPGKHAFAPTPNWLLDRTRENKFQLWRPCRQDGGARNALVRRNHQ